MFTLRNRMGMAVLAAAVVCGLGSEAWAQSGKVYEVNMNTGAAGRVFGTYTTFPGGTVRITTMYYVYDLYLGGGTPTAVGTLTKFVQRDAKSLEPVYGGRAELVAASNNIWFKTTGKYFGNKISGYTFREFPTGGTMRLLLGPPGS